MTWINDLIEQLPDLISYITPGFLFVNSFVWILQKEFKNTTVQIISSVVCSYFIWEFLEKYFPNTSNVVLLIISSIIVVISGLLFGKLYKSPYFNNFLGKLKLDRTTNESIIEDSIGTNSWVALFDENQQKYYCGQFRYGEEKSKYITIVTYYIADVDMKILEDYRNLIERKLLLNISDFKYVIFSPDDPLNKK